MTGVMMVSSGMLCSVIHVVSTAFFELRPGALFRARAVGGDVNSMETFIVVILFPSIFNIIEV